MIEECVFLINNQTRVQTLLTSLEACSGDPLILQPLCQVCHNLLVSHRSATHRYRILNLLALRPSFLRAVWSAVLAVTQTSIFGEATPLLNVIARGVQTTPDDSVKIVPLLAVFCSLYTMLLITLHDAEFYSDQISGKIEKLSIHVFLFLILLMLFFFLSLHFSFRCPSSNYAIYIR